MNTSLKVLIISLALLCVSHAHDGYSCDHDKIEQNPTFLEVEEDMSANANERVLASGGFRIYPYYEFVKDSASSSYASYVINELFPPAIDYFQAALSVKYPVIGDLKLGSSVRSICERSTPSILRSGVSADFFLSIDTHTESGNQIASARYCYLASGSKRPLISRIMINRNMLQVAGGDILLHEKNMYVMMHEMMHGLGFSSSLYRYFVDSNGNTRSGHIKKVKVNGNTRTFIDVPPLTEKLRDHFGCSSLQGALMENSGGSETASSHFERQVFLYEAMTSGSIPDRRISELSLALLEGSGWYNVDYDYAEPFFFGKGQGCSFVTGSSPANFDEFCSSGGSKGCAPTGRGGGSCSSDSLTEGYKYYNPSTYYDCENEDAQDYARLPDLQVFGRGANSKCFTGTLNTRSSNSQTSFCFKYSCSGSGSDTVLEVQVGSHKVTCTEEGSKTIDGYYGSVDCPDPLTFCNTVGKKYCPRNCMGRGTCSNGKCKCNSGFSGVDCALSH